MAQTRKTAKPKKTRKEHVKAVKQTLTHVRKQMNIPNLLTSIRIWAIPVIVATFFFDSPLWAWVGVVLFALAGITDYMDGYLARHLNQLSRFGRVLDPIADKLLVGAILLMLAHEHRLPYLGIIPAVIIMCREILVSGLREFLAEIKVGMPVTKLAKYKTACQMISLPVLMVADVRFSGCLSPVLTTLGA
ncbi:MAG: CDP-diacylglycerol--glycerol-3-phosphate 3-phosphatidyltransferase, partial [Lactobacillales bacterium]|nr:CDP-diacylglycerol--glycerol-3-phosphate 3-phosphatidyltransferase [Lactobacillales bacterium]